MKDGKIIYSDGKVIVNDFTKDSKNPIELKEYDYQDNIEEILKTENIIETLEIEKGMLENKIIHNADSIESLQKFKKMLIHIIIITSIIGSILLSTTAFFNGRFDLINSILFGSVSGTSIPSLFCSVFLVSTIKERKSIIKRNNGYKLYLEELKKELIKSKEQLSKLKSDKEKNNQKEKELMKYSNIHNIHSDKLGKIIDYLMIYYEIGKNEKRLEKYYNEGSLDKRIGQQYEKEEVEKIKTYFKSKKSTI